VSKVWHREYRHAQLAEGGVALPLILRLTPLRRL